MKNKIHVLFCENNDRQGTSYCYFDRNESREKSSRGSYTFSSKGFSCNVILFYSNWFEKIFSSIKCLVQQTKQHDETMKNNNYDVLSCHEYIVAFLHTKNILYAIFYLTWVKYRIRLHVQRRKMLQFWQYFLNISTIPQ